MIEPDLRKFLLGMSDADAERRTEERILDGGIDLDQLQWAEDELIDEYVFGRLSGEEERRFTSHFLMTQERRNRLEFAASLARYASSHRVQPEAQAGPARPARFGFLGAAWKLTALAAALIAAIGLGLQDAHLRSQLQQARQSSGEIDRLRSEIEQDQARSAHLPQTGNESGAVSNPAARPPANTELFPALVLIPGLTRGIARVPVLQIPPGATVAWIALELPAPLGKTFREELIGADGDRIWSQEFDSQIPAVTKRSTIELPASLLAPGDYQIRIEEPSSSGAFEESETYAFRVPRNQPRN